MSASHALGLCRIIVGPCFVSVTRAWLQSAAPDQQWLGLGPVRLVPSHTERLWLTSMLRRPKPARPIGWRRPVTCAGKVARALLVVPCLKKETDTLTTDSGAIVQRWWVACTAHSHYVGAQLSGRLFLMGTRNVHLPEEEAECDWVVFGGKSNDHDSHLEARMFVLCHSLCGMELLAAGVFDPLCRQGAAEASLHNCLAILAPPGSAQWPCFATNAAQIRRAIALRRWAGSRLSYRQYEACNSQPAGAASFLDPLWSATERVVSH